MIVWLLIACSGSPNVDDAKEGARSDSVPFVDTSEPDLPGIDTTELKPSWSAEQVSEALSAALGNIPNAEEAFNTYVNLMANGDSRCPGSEQIIVDSWLYGCDASTGYSYAGVTDWLTGEYEVMGQSVDLQGIAGDFWIDTPEGHRLEAGGNAVVLKNGVVWVGDLSGSWRYTGGSDWLSYGFSGTIGLEVIANFYVQVEGAMDVMGTHVAMHDLVLPADCDGGAQGALSLRDPNGGWYRLEFSSCTPCASLSFEDEPLGETCVDFEPFLARVGSWL